ncbi:MAG: hypothetical protein E3J43_04565, partial [Candidatus Heimdallarchaeota archaeon]
MKLRKRRRNKKVKKKLLHKKVRRKLKEKPRREGNLSFFLKRQQISYFIYYKKQVILMSLKEITNMDLKYILVGGKGGVGKTSIASALGIALAELGKRVLIISTDPAHSVSDSFDMDFSSGEITKVKGVVGDLFALEINPATAGEEISKAIGQPVDSDQFSQFSAIPGLGELQQGLGQDLKSIPPPGMDEALSFAKILEYAEDEVYDTVILDTAPTG